MNKWIVIVVPILFVLGLWGIYEAGYASGKTDEQISTLKKTTEGLNKIVDKVTDVDAKLNEQALAQAQIKALIMEKQGSTVKEVIKYAQKPDSNTVCLDDEWVQIYNGSLPNAKGAGSVPPFGFNATGGTSDSNAKQTK